MIKNIPHAISFALSFLILVVIGHFFIYKAVITIFSITNLRTLYFIRWGFFVSSLSFISMTIITQLGYSSIGSFLYKVSAVWLGTVYFLSLASFLFLVIFLISQSLGVYSNILKIIGLGLLILAIGISIFGIFNSFKINITKYNVVIDNLPEFWKNKKIVMLADSHFGNVRSVDFGNRLILKINEQNPEIVLIAGDYYDGPPVDIEQIANLMSKVKTKKGIFFASGNHEEYGDVSNFIKFLSISGVNILNNKMIEIEGLQIIGIDNESGLTPSSVLGVLERLDLYEDKPKILIKHIPTILPEISDLGFDLVVSGHTHNGQVWPGPYLTSKVFKGFSYGLNFIDKMAVITTSGAGTWGPPQRVGTKSEIVVIELNK